jgi:hypothetical protein
MSAPHLPGSGPLVWLQDEISLRGKKRATLVCIVESPQPEDLSETITSLLETGLSQLAMMREALQVIEKLLRRDGRFDDLAREVGTYREIVFRKDRHGPFTMIEARAIMSTMRRWLETINHRVASSRD